MTFDLLLKRARIADRSDTLVDIGVRGERIAAIAPSLPAGGAEIEDANGSFVSAGLVESHIHLDKSRILDRCGPAPNRGTDHMRRVSAVKPGFTVDDVYARASRTLEACVSHGTTHVRTHVEIDPNVGLRGFAAIDQLARDYRWAVDLEICVFAQEGLTNSSEADANLVSALERGASVIGGAPGYDPDRAGQIRRIFELAREYDVDVDIHLDVGADAGDLDAHLVCKLTERFGWGGRVAIGHGSKYSCLPPDELRRLGERLAERGSR